jgi:hypothetical protein
MSLRRTPPAKRAGPFVSTAAGIVPLATFARAGRGRTGGGCTTIPCSTADRRRARRQHRHPRGGGADRQGARLACAERGPIGCRRRGCRRGAIWPPARGAARAGCRREDWSVDAGLNVSYEVDLFGRVSRGVEAARGDVGAAEADADAVRVDRRCRHGARLCRCRLGAARLEGRAAASSTCSIKSMGLTQRATSAGLATRLDVARIAALRNQRAGRHPRARGRAPGRSVPPRDADRAHARRSSGRSRRERARRAAKIDQPIPVGDGTALLARRPDVHAAERRLAASPRGSASRRPISIRRSRSVRRSGRPAPAIGDIFGGGPLRWLLGPLISWSLSTRSPARARIAGPKADSQASLATFDGTVLTRAGRNRNGALHLCPRARPPHRAAGGARTRPRAPRPSPAPSSAKARSIRWPGSMPSAPGRCRSRIWSRPTPRSPNARSICSGRWAAAGNRRTGALHSAPTEPRSRACRLPRRRRGISRAPYHERRSDWLNPCVLWYGAFSQ